MPEPLLPLFVEPDVLEQKLGTNGLLIVDLNEEPIFLEEHIPGAVNLSYASLIGPRPPAMGTIAGAEQISAAFSAIGLTPDHHVVAYDTVGTGKASRFLWTLDVIKHPKASLLNGGFHSWKGEGYPTETGSTTPNPSKYHVKIGESALAGKEYILDHLDDNGVVILDCRTPAEFSGEDLRSARGGHIPGAVSISPWENTREERVAQLAEKEDPAAPVVVYCTRSKDCEDSEMVSGDLKALGFTNVLIFQGGFPVWQEQEKPVTEGDEAGTRPGQ